jgi:hypothetical protein
MGGIGGAKRLTGTVGLLLLAVGLIAAAAFLYSQGLDRSTQWVGLVGGTIAVVAVARKPVQTLLSLRKYGGVLAHAKVADVAEDLAKALAVDWREWRQWRDENNPGTLRVRWTMTPEADLAMTGVSWDDVGTPTLTMDPLLMTTGGDAIYQAFLELVPRGRLVVLGQAGGGKSSIARQLAQDLLAQRPGGGRVPVFLPLASWDPEERLYDWVARQLSRDRQDLRRLVAGPLGRPPVPLAKALIDNDHLLLILDGFDEIAEQSRVKALDRIYGLGDQVPLVLTSRTAEYVEAIQEQGRGMPRAGVVELVPVSARAIKRYLARTTAAVPAGRWDQVFALLDKGDMNPVAWALRTPLMIWLAYVVYRGKGTFPGELADSHRFADATAVERHLLDSMVPAAYMYPSPGGRSWQRGQPQRWLGFLARWLERERTHDLAWWQLPGAADRRLDRVAAGLPVGMAAGVPTGVIVAAMDGLAAGLASGVAVTVLATARAFSRAVRWPALRLPGPTLGRAVALAIGLAAGLPFAFRGNLATGVAHGVAVGMLAGVAAGFIVHEGRTQPVQVRLRVRGNVRDFLRRLSLGLLLGLAFGAVLGGTLGVLSGLATGLVYGLLSLVMGLALGVEDGLQLWLDAPTDLMRSASPRMVLSDDRFAALERALFAGPLAGVAAGLAVGFAYGAMTGVEVGAAMAIAFAVSDRMVGVASSCWGGFTLARGWLALRGDLPWRLITFLEDAYDLGVLRRSGTVLQFRHARLQQRLAISPAGQAPLAPAWQGTRG